MKNRLPFRATATCIAANMFLYAVQVGGATTDISQTPLSTYSAQSSIVVKPNILFVLDDSGSMAWTYMPDWADDTPGGFSSLPEYLSKNSSFNGIAYNPAIRYQPPIAVNADGSNNLTTYPSMDGTSTSTGADNTTKPNWKAVKYDGYGVQSTSTSSLVDNAYFYVTKPGEFCDASNLRGCTATASASGSYAYPAYLRWCNSNSLTTCKATYDAYSGYVYPRSPAPRVATLEVSGAVSTSITGITVDGNQILPYSTTSSSTASNVASRIAFVINDCSNRQTGNCTTAGYTATSSGSTVYIMAPGVTSTTPTVITSPSTGGMTVTASTFDRGSIPLVPYWDGTSTRASAVPGEVLRVPISLSYSNSYPYPGTNAKAPGRTDCAGTTCTYIEEMTNYANWRAYYRTRMQMMKTSMSRAFSGIDSATDIVNGVSQFRVGFSTINNNNGNKFLNIADFSLGQKQNWYNMLFAAYPDNNTPLREALSKAGRLYGGRLNGSTFNDVTVEDPLQFSCQHNYTILSTDGFWNGNDGFKLDGTTAVGNQDAGYPGAYGDGGSVQWQTRTRQLQTRTNQRTAQLGTLQSRTSELQKKNLLLYQDDSSDSGVHWVNGTVAVESCTWDTSGKSRRRCRYETDWTAPVDTTSCTPRTPGTSSSGTWYTGVACPYTAWTTWQDAGSCSPLAQSSGTGTWSRQTATQCQYNWQSTAGTAACTPTYVANNYTNPTVYRNCTTANGTWAPASDTCTANATPDPNGYTTECQYSAWTGWSNVSSCTATPQSPSSPYSVLSAAECQSIVSSGTSDTLADVAAYYYYKDLRSNNNAGLPTADRTGTCTGPIISPNTTPNDLCADNVPAAGLDNNAKQHMTTFTIGLGAQGKMVYSDWQNDQSGNRTYTPDYWSQKSGDFYDVNQGSTPNSTTGICSWMASGKCSWPAPTDNSNANIDDLWHAAVNGRGTYFSASDPTSLSYALESTLSQISKVPRPGAAAAAASSNPNITSTDNYIFSSSYRSVEWWGELIRQQLNSDGTLSSQQWSAMQLLDCATTPWQASHAYSVGNLFGRSGVCYLVTSAYVSDAAFDTSSVDTNNTTVVSGGVATRHIYTPNAAGSALVNFDWDSLASSQQSYFSLPYLAYNSGAGTGLTQFCTNVADPNCLSSSRQSDNTSAGAAGVALINYLSGNRTHEGTDFRTRVHVLGDVVSSEARYVQKPLFFYTDTGYSEYKTLHASRSSAVYVAANDGMLHAFDGATGTENWAFIPSAVLPEMYRLADMHYGDNHQYLVDGSPEVGDICPNAPSATCSSTEWRTILVGGLNAGGKSFYALDVTDPASPSLLWEFSHSTMGYSYGNPRIAKLRNGTWVVILSSGYNNSDGVGRIYVLNASTGQLISSITGGAVAGVISTGTGTPSNPSGLAKISAHVQYPMTDNTVMAVYGGDLLGNLWRFDVNNSIGAAGYDAHRMVTFTDASGKVQPITAKPVVTTVNGLPVVYVGTGRYLGTSDVANTDSQSFYAVKDTSGSAPFLNPRTTGSTFVEQTLTSTTCPTGADASTCSPGQSVLTASSNAVNWNTNNGWFLDFVVGGERASTDPSLGLGTLVFTTIKPNVISADPCGGGGTDTSSSNVYFLDYLTGSALPGQNNVVGLSLGLGVATRPVLVKQADGTVQALIRQPGGTTGTDQGRTTVLKVKTKGGSGGMRRVSWRELSGE